MMIHRDIDEVSPGAALAADVLGASGHVLVRAGTALTPKQLRILKAHGIARITIQVSTAHLQASSTPIPTEPHVLELFRYNNTNHPLIKELIRLRELRAGRPNHGFCQHDH